MSFGPSTFDIQRSDNILSTWWMKPILGFGALVVAVWFALLVFDFGMSRWKDDSEVQLLVQQLRDDITRLNDDPALDWKITEADLEMTISVSNTEGGKVAVKAVGEGTAASTRQSGHTLIIRLRRELPQLAIPEVARTSALQ
jgi:hypothetical protein